MHSPAKVNGETQPYGLTVRQREIMEQLVAGKVEREVAVVLGLSYHTVHTHVRKAYEKLDVSSRAQATAKWLGQRPVVNPPLTQNRLLTAIRYCPDCGCHLAAWQSR
jgi:DNA-binding CsgD family transcriptional regulator